MDSLIERRAVLAIAGVAEIQVRKYSHGKLVESAVDLAVAERRRQLGRRRRRAHVRVVFASRRLDAARGDLQIERVKLQILVIRRRLTLGVMRLRRQLHSQPNSTSKLLLLIAVNN